MIYQCCNENRKAAVLGNPILNGIDYLEVLDHDAIPLDSPRQRTLLVHCLNNAPTSLAPSNVLITGGESIKGMDRRRLWTAFASHCQRERISDCACRRGQGAGDSHK
jgi:hypothetical protein